MSYQSVRTTVRIAAALSWFGVVAAAVACSAMGHDAKLDQILRITILIVIITATLAVVEVTASAADRIVEAMPSADEIAARAILHGKVLTREELERQADILPISDYRQR